MNTELNTFYGDFRWMNTELNTSTSIQYSIQYSVNTVNFILTTSPSLSSPLPNFEFLLLVKVVAETVSSLNWTEQIEEKGAYGVSCM